MAVHRLSRDQANIHYRWDGSLPPALTVESGDEVIIETRSGEDDQVRPVDGADKLAEIDMSRLHALSGPIEVLGARPGHILVIHILEIKTGDWGFIMQRPGAGLIRGFEPYLRTFDLSRGTVEFAPGVQVELHPFLGVMGVAPANGPQSTRPPGDHGGNLDCAQLVAGTTLHLPVYHPGALFSCGDGHAAQGDGEVCVTAIECQLDVRLRFELLEGAPIARPRLETRTELMTMGAGRTLEAAARQALEDMLDLIVAVTGMSRPDAYALASAAVDLRVNQVVNEPMMGMRAVVSKAVLGV